MGELWGLGAVELAALIRNRSVSSVEVVQAHLDRIAAVNGASNAVTTVLDDALAQAAEADRRPSGRPLHGVPFTIKENIDVAGSVTSWGVPALSGSVAPRDAPVVERMRAAGAIAMARTNMAEMGLRVSTDNPLHGRTVNPWHPGLTAGGSSGGDGVALATGMTPLGLANDIGGSLRSPAFCDGVCALKPTTGRVPSATSIPPLDFDLAGQVLATDGPMARRVADLRLALEVLSGRHVRDPRSTDAPIDGPRVPRTAALVTELSMPAEYRTAVRAAGRALEAAGYEVVEATPPDLGSATEVWLAIMRAGLASELATLQLVMSPPASELLREAFDRSTMPIDLAFVERHRLQRTWSEFFASHAVVVGPAWTGPPFAHDADIEPDHGFELTLGLLQFMLPANLLGVPAAAVPAGLADALPLGVQIYADLWRDDLALAAAQIIEDELGTITPIDPRGRSGFGPTAFWTAAGDPTVPPRRLADIV